MELKLERNGIKIEPSVQFHDDIKKYFSGVFLINQERMKTNRMTTDKEPYSSEKEAEEASIKMGKIMVDNHFSGKQKLYFDQSM